MCQQGRRGWDQVQLEVQDAARFWLNGVDPLPNDVSSAGVPNVQARSDLQT